MPLCARPGLGVFNGCSSDLVLQRFSTGDINLSACLAMPEALFSTLVCLCIHAAAPKTKNAFGPLCPTMAVSSRTVSSMLEDRGEEKPNKTSPALF